MARPLHRKDETSEGVPGGCACSCDFLIAIPITFIMVRGWGEGGISYNLQYIKRILSSQCHTKKER